MMYSSFSTTEEVLLNSLGNQAMNSMLPFLLSSQESMGGKYFQDTFY